MVEFHFSNIAAEHMSRNGYTEHDILGLIPAMLSDANPDDPVVQLDNGYKHGGGWHEFSGFTFDEDTKTLRYPGDPPMRLIAWCQLREDRVMLFESSWVAVVRPDGRVNVSRMD